MKYSFLIILGIMVSLSNYFSQNIYSLLQPEEKVTDFLLEVQNASTIPFVKQFAIENEVYDQICPDDQCSIKYSPHSSSNFSLPSDNYPFMYHSFHFKINYNQSDSENSPIKEYTKKLKNHQINFLTGGSTCFIDFHKSIINEKQRIYYCEDDGVDTSITRIYDNKRWYYDTIEKYDAESDLFTLKGNFRK